MTSFIKAALLLTVLLAASAPGCGGSSEVITDPSKLPTVTDDQKKAIAEADAKIAQEENANPTKPTKGKAGK
ncbi:MAG: hypothetical protein U0835_05720 [Isosphaeraceae bacterium]